MTLRFLSKGPAGQISGGYLYNKYLLEHLRSAGGEVTYHADPTNLHGFDATDTVIVDSLVLPQTAERLLSTPANLILLLHVVPASDATGTDGKPILESLYRRSRVVVTGDSTLTSLRQDLNRAGIDAVKIEPGVPGHWRRKRDYADKARRLLIVANYVRGKGITRAIEVLLPLKDLPWTLTVFGNDALDPAHFAAVTNKAASCGLADRIALHGAIPHDEVNREMLEADLLVHLSDHESYSMVTAEAIACGLPVLSYRTGNHGCFGRSGLVRYLDRDGPVSQALGTLLADHRAYGQLRRVGTPATRTWQDVGREFVAWLARDR